MQFLVLAYDYTTGAVKRRLAVRSTHLKLLKDLQQQKKCLYAARLEDEHHNTIGSMMIFDYPSRAALDAMLQEEPYTKNNVWERIEITQCIVVLYMKLRTKNEPELLSCSNLDVKKFDMKVRT